MAYFLTYIAEFNQRRSNTIRVEIYHKDVDPGSPATITNTELLSVTVGYPNGEESKYDCIISAEANIAMRVKTGSSITPETFITELYDEWKVLIFCDTIPVFTGFIEPSEGSYLMKDVPIQIQIKCTDGLGLLKNIPLTDPNGDTLVNSTLTLAQYAAYALKKTNLDLHILIYCDIYESSMNDRSLDIVYDMFGQAKLEYRTFLKNATEFEDCYRALEILLTGGFCIFQWQGNWVISYRPTLLQSAGPVTYRTEYDTNGIAVAGSLDDKTYIEIGLEKQQHAINLDQLISYQVPAKTIRTQYNYVPWPEIPKNNRFERGTFFEQGNQADEEDNDNDGDTSEIIGTYKKYTIDGWDFGSVDFFGDPPFTLTAAGEAHYRRSIYNEFGVEIKREIIIQTPADSRSLWMRSEGLPMGKGDKFVLGFQKRFDADFTGGGSTFTIPARVYLLPDEGTTWYALSNNVDGAGTGTGHWVIRDTTGLPPSQLLLDYVEDQNSAKYSSFSVASLPLPVSGKVYIALEVAGPIGATGNLQYYTDFDFSYQSFIAGGYIQVKGDYWQTSQDRNLKDVISDEVLISDSTKRLLKGTLLREDGLTATTPTWYRYPGSESKHYKELLNLGKYNHYYRRFRKISGTFRGVKSHSVNFMGDFYPIGFHKHYVFMDNDTSRYYVLVPPLQIDYGKGTFSGIFIECFKNGDIEQGGDTHEFNFIFT